MCNFYSQKALIQLDHLNIVFQIVMFLNINVIYLCNFGIFYMIVTPIFFSLKLIRVSTFFPLSTIPNPQYGYKYVKLKQYLLCSLHWVLHHFLRILNGLKMNFKFM